MASRGATLVTDCFKDYGTMNDLGSSTNCVYCGKEADDRLCEEHRTIPVLDELLVLVGRYAPERCDNPHVSAYVESFEKWRDAYQVDFPSILALFPDEEIEYQRCFYLGDVKDEAFEDAAVSFLDSHDWADGQSQVIMHMLLQAYSRRDFFKPAPYVDFISETEGLLHELYASAISFLGMTGDYDEAAELIGFAREQTVAGAVSRWGWDVDRQLVVLDEALVQNEKWRARPYWPKSPEAREQLAEVYASKGIEPGKRGGSGRAATWPKKVSQKDFAPFVVLGEASDDFCAVWLRDVPGRVKGVCEIVAVKVEDGDQAGGFESLVRPWKVSRADKSLAASCLGVTCEEIDSAPDVFEAFPKFLEFAGGLPLVLADSSQAKLLERAARYSGISRVENAVCIIGDAVGGEASFAASVLDGITGAHASESAYRFAGMHELDEPTFDSFVAFDTETTGFGRDDQITEIGAVRVAGGEVVERFQMLANPGKGIPGPVQQLTGITDAMVADAKPYQDVAKLFKEFAGDAVLVGHNVGFDIRMLAQAALPTGIDFTNDYFDTNQYAKKLKQAQGWEQTKLGYLAEQLGVELSNAHRALADAEATAGVYLKLIQKHDS